MKKNFRSWLDLFVRLQDQLPDTSGLVCPHCGAESVDYQYVGDMKSRVGYLRIWCEKCLTGIHLSRVEAPQPVELLSFDCPSEVISTRIPQFREISP